MYFGGVSTNSISNRQKATVLLNAILEILWMHFLKALKAIKTSLANSSKYVNNGKNEEAEEL